MTDPWEAVEYPPEFKRAAKEYVQPRSFLRRGLYPALEPESPIPSYDDIISGKADAEMDQPTIDPTGAIGMPAALSSIRKLHKLKTQSRMARGWSKKAAVTMHKTEASDITRVVKGIPQRLWDRVRNVLKLEGKGIKHVRARHQQVPTLVPGMDEADVLFNPSKFRPADIAHEVTGHEGSRMAKEASENIPNLKTLRNWWDTTHDEMNSLQRWIKRKGGDEDIARRVYAFSPDEIFSRHIEKTTFTMGVDPTTAIVDAHRQVHANIGPTLKALREGLEEANRIEKTMGNKIDVDRIMKWYKDKANFSESMETGLRRYQPDYYKVGKGK